MPFVMLLKFKKTLCFSEGGHYVARVLKMCSSWALLSLLKLWVGVSAQF